MSLSILSIQEIFRNIDANKRLMISMECPSLRKYEKSVALKLENLKFIRSSISVNDTIYKFGEIQGIQNTQKSKLDEFEIRRIEYQNSVGGMEWRSLKDDVPESGDVVLNNRDVFFQEKDKFQIAQELRRLFLESLEDYLNGRSDFDPLEIFNRRINEKWKIDFNEMFLKMGGASNKVLEKVYDVFHLIMYSMEEGEYREDVEFPKAFEAVNRKIDKLGHKDEGWILKKLLFPREMLPHFNQFTILKSESQSPEAIHRQRLPENSTLRKCLKQFQNAVFGGRPPIQVSGEFEIDGFGIIVLPENLKVSVRNLSVFAPRPSIFNAYEKIIYGKVGTVSFAFAEGYDNFLKAPLVKSSTNLRLRGDDIFKSADEIQFLENDSLHLFPIQPLSNYKGVIENWMKNENRKVDDEMVIWISEEDSLRVNDSNQFGELGFTNFQRANYWYRPMTNSKMHFVLTVERDCEIVEAGKHSRIWLKVENSK